MNWMKELPRDPIPRDEYGGVGSEDRSGVTGQDQTPPIVSILPGEKTRYGYERCDGRTDPRLRGKTTTGTG